MTRAAILDAAIVGAGPAGAWTACLLARGGARVGLFDGSHPREKPCGGGVTGRALQLVAAALDPARLAAVSIRTARFSDAASGADAAAVAAAPPVTLAPGVLVVANRQQFDGALLEAASRAGATHVRGRVLSVVRERRGFQLETTAGRYESARVIGADGANSLVRRRLARAFRRDQLSIATGYFAHGATSTEVVVEFRANPPGYLWSFPRPDHLALGICAQADEGVQAEALRAHVSSWMTRTGLGSGTRLEPYSWPIPSLGEADFAALDPAGDGWLLVGDAAGLVDPITREGIFFALLSGQRAAEAILSARGDAHRDYVERIRAEIGDDLRRAARIKATFFRPRFIELLIQSLASSSRIREVMADLVAGTQSYRTLRTRLLKTWEFGLAWKLARTLRL